MKHPVRALTLLTLLTLLVGAGKSHGRSKTDVVIILNGDRVTCEIKGLARGKLTVSTSDMGTIDIEWDKVAELHSIYFFRVEDVHGARFFGKLGLDRDAPNLDVIGDETMSLPAWTIVEIVPIEQTFWARQDGALSFGLSYTKASDVGQLSLAWANKYRTERNLWDLSASTIITDKHQENETTKRVDVALTYYRLLHKRGWTGYANVALQRNDELNLGRRFLLGGGAGFNLVRSNKNLLLLSLGVTLNSEVATDSTSSTQSAEGVVSANYSLFKYDSPKTDINSSLNFYPSITEKDRYRVDFEVKLGHEIISDFMIDVSYYTNFDNQPASGEKKKVDYGIVLSLRWTY